MVITFSSMKGGVGKSTDAVLLANNLAARGFKVLFFDMDTNNSSTIYYCMGIADEFPVQNVAEALTHRTTEGYTVHSRIPNIDIVPSSLRLFDIRSIDYHVLKKSLPKDEYDFIIIDTAPTYANLVLSLLPLLCRISASASMQSLRTFDSYTKAGRALPLLFH